MADVTITGAGAHAAAAATDHIPASKAGVKGYLTPAQIATFVENDQALTGDVTKAQNTSATVIAALAVTVAKMSLSATLRLVGRTTAGAGAGEELTVGAGLVLATGALGRAALTGDVTAAADGNATTIAAAAVTYAKMQNVSATSRVLGRVSAGAGSPEELTPANIATIAIDPTTANGVGYLGIPQNAQSAAYTTVMGDNGRHIYHPAADTTARIWTIDSNANVAYPIGAVLTFINEAAAGIITLAITADTLAWGAATGSRSLAPNGVATAVKVTPTKWRLTGEGIT